MRRNGVSVVYPTCGRPELLLRSVTALLQGTVVPDEIIVVDQSRGDACRDALARLGCERIVHVPSAERGLSRARNTGIETVRTPFVGFLDDDCIPACDWLALALQEMQRHPRSSVWIGALLRDESLLEVAVPDPERVRTLTVRGVHDPWYVGPTGGNSLFRMNVFDTVGLFDPLLGQGSDFPGAEDGDMIYRVLRANFEVTFSAGIRCFHVGWRSEEQNIDNGYNYGQGVGALLAKYVDERDFFPLMVVFPRRFLSKFLAVPYNLVLARKFARQVNLRWSQGIVRGFVDWRRMR